MISARLIRIGSLAFAVAVGSLVMTAGASAAPPKEGQRGPGKMQQRDGHHRHLTKRQKAKLRHWMKHHRRGDHRQDAARPWSKGPRGDFRGPQRGEEPRGDFRGPPRGEGPRGDMRGGPRMDGPRGDFRGPRSGAGPRGQFQGRPRMDGPRGDFRGRGQEGGPRGDVQRPRKPRQDDTNERPQRRQGDGMENRGGPGADGPRGE